MDTAHILIVRQRITRRELVTIATAQFGDMVKAVVDVARNVMAVGGDLHADEESTLIDDGSRQSEVWGINLDPAESGDEWIEFDSMINVRPSANNRTRGVDDPSMQKRIRQVVDSLIMR